MTLEEANALDLDGIKAFFVAGNPGNLIMAQFSDDLISAETKVINGEIDELVAQNTQLGGSPHGYYYNSELFTTSATYNLPDISEVHESLTDPAKAIKANTAELRRDINHIGNFLAVLTMDADNILEFLANIPPELPKFVLSLRVLESAADNKQDNWREEYVFDREDPANAIFFMHFDRIQPSLQRYLFRRVVT